MEKIFKSTLFWFVVGGIFFKYLLDVFDILLSYLTNKQQLDALKVQTEVNKIMGTQEEVSTNAIGFNLDFSEEDDYEEED